MTAALMEAGFAPGEGLRLSEQMIAGSAISSRQQAERLAETGLRAEHFWQPAHQMIYAAAGRLAEDGKPVDPAAVLAELARGGDLGKMGGGPYLHTCLAVAALPGSADYHARQVIADYRRRMLNVAASQIVQATCAADFDLDAASEQARVLLDGATLTSGAPQLQPVAELAAQVIGGLRSTAPRGLGTGWRDLDEALACMVPGQLILLAARPGTGKSLAAACIAHHVGTALKLPVLFVSAEMTPEEITQRLLAAEARVPLSRVLSRQINAEEWERITAAGQRLEESALVIDYAPACTLPRIRARLRGMARRSPARLLVMDYVQLGTVPRAQSREQEVAAFSRGLKVIAGETGLPVLACAQLNRNPEARPGKRPQLADLRESGELEQAADVVILLHREDAYDKASPKAGLIEFIIAKNRQGPQATVTMTFQGHYSRCVPAAWSPSSVLARR